MCLHSQVQLVVHGVHVMIENTSILKSLQECPSGTILVITQIHKNGKGDWVLCMVNVELIMLIDFSIYIGVVDVGGWKSQENLNVHLVLWCTKALI